MEIFCYTCIVLTVELSDGPLVPVQYGGEHKGDAQHHTGQQDQGHQRLLGSGYEATLKHKAHQYHTEMNASISIQVYQGHQGLLGSRYEAPLKHEAHLYRIIQRWVYRISGSPGSPWLKV
jgi:hypothetical protein